jgi:lipoate---protein ligase
MNRFDNILLPDWDPLWSETKWEIELWERLRSVSLDLIVTDPQPSLLNMALDEVLLYRVAEGRRNPLLWLWDWSERAIVIGSYQSVANEIDRDAAAAEGFAFARRISGGGAMVVEPGRTITYSLVVPESFVADLSFVQSFACLDQWCVRALRAIGVPVVYKPINDIAAPDGKLAGAAQCRRKGTVLHHTTMAYAFDNELMMRIMRLRRPVLNAKGILSAVKAVSPLDAMTPMSRDEVVAWFVAAAARMFTMRESELRVDELTEARERVERKFASKEWLYRVE